MGGVQLVASRHRDPARRRRPAVVLAAGGHEVEQVLRESTGLIQGEVHAYAVALADVDLCLGLPPALLQLHRGHVRLPLIGVVLDVVLQGNRHRDPVSEVSPIAHEVRQVVEVHPRAPRRHGSVCQNGLSTRLASPRMLVMPAPSGVVGD